MTLSVVYIYVYNGKFKKKKNIIAKIDPKTEVSANSK